MKYYEKNGENDDILREMCISNGLPYTKIQEEGLKVHTIEMFFSGYNKFACLHYFKNIQKLILIGQELTKISNMNHIINLKELWICECKLKDTAGLECLTKLKKLCLYDNNISDIYNLESLCNLEYLSLCNNQICSLNGVSNLKQLKYFNVAENQIQNIGSHLDTLNHLETIELSGNRINSLTDVKNLCGLESLRHLSLRSTLYTGNPVTLLCNYVTYLLYFMPLLKSLDGDDVTSKSLKLMAETTTDNKKIFYNMKMKRLFRILTVNESNLSLRKHDILKPALKRIKKLSLLLRQIDYELEKLLPEEPDNTKVTSIGKEADGDNKEINIKAFYAKRSSIEIRISLWEKRCKDTEMHCNTRIRLLREDTRGKIDNLISELRTGGNLRFEEGIDTDVWYSSCSDLLTSRFCAFDFREHGVTGVKVVGITRIHNLMRRMRFDDAYREHLQCVDKEKKQPLNGLIEYLFWIWHPSSKGGVQDDLMTYLEQGFPTSDQYKKMDMEAGVPLTNSLLVADRTRLAKYRDRPSTIEGHSSFKGHSIRSTGARLRGKFVVCKVFIGQCSGFVESKSVDPDNYPSSDSIFRGASPEAKQACVSSFIHDSLPRPVDSCECTSTQSEWFVFDSDFVVPEYVVDFEYMSKLQPTSPFDPHYNNIGELVQRSLVAVDSQPEDEDVHSMSPSTSKRCKMNGIDKDFLLSINRSLGNITQLNLYGCGLKSLETLRCLQHLKHLDASFNSLERVDDLSHMGELEYLDISFNEILTLEGMRSMTGLRTLNMSWNSFTCTREEISFLRKHVCLLVTLDTRHNPWLKSENKRIRIIGRLKSLTKLDGEAITDLESEKAITIATGSRITQAKIISNSYTNKDFQRSLCLKTNVELLMSDLGEKFSVNSTDLETVAYNTITTLNLNSQNLTKISNLESLENLRWVSFDCNHIGRIEGLDKCLLLEELTLSNNCLTRLDGLSQLNNLKRLDISHNLVHCLQHASLHLLTKLEYLDLNDNRVSSLAAFVTPLNSLSELYLSNNTIKNIRELFNLKQLGGLMIIDLQGNQAAYSLDNYRMFVIYHLKTLKALDGKPVELHEIQHCKEIFGGRLTVDFVAEKMPLVDFSKIKELDFPTMSIRSVDLGRGEFFNNLRSVNLEHNNLTSFGGLVYLINLRVLCLNHNHIENILCPVVKTSASSTIVNQAAKLHGNGATASQQLPARSSASIYNDIEPGLQVLVKLEVLHLGYNGIRDMTQLQLYRVPSLKALFLQGNEINKIDGLESLRDLQELVLDRNRIKCVNENSFQYQWNLQELHLEENRLKDLSHIGNVTSLRRLFLGMNRVQDFNELEKLDPIQNLLEISLISNAVARRMLHRPILIYRLPTLSIIDGITVMDEERSKTIVYFNDFQPASQTAQTDNIVLPGLCNAANFSKQHSGSGHLSMKVTNMQLGGGWPLQNNNVTSLTGEDTAKRLSYKSSSDTNTTYKGTIRHSPVAQTNNYHNDDPTLSRYKSQKK